MSSKHTNSTVHAPGTCIEDIVVFLSRNLLPMEGHVGYCTLWGNLKLFEVYFAKLLCIMYECVCMHKHHLLLAQ